MSYYVFTSSYYSDPKFFFLSERHETNQIITVKYDIDTYKQKCAF